MQPHLSKPMHHKCPMSPPIVQPLCSFTLYTFLNACTIIIFLLPSLQANASQIHTDNRTDHEALITIKSQITQDPLGITKSWTQSLHFCKWAGISCGHLHQRVTNLNLSSLHLGGTLSPFIGNLTFLAGINLELNSFRGPIPPEIGGLFRLRHLNLTNNSFSGEIPATISQCRNLVHLRLGWNNLTGKIPFQVGLLQKLERLHFHYNNLSGPIPENFGNLSSIKSLSMAVNNLWGSIPESLGKLRTLTFLGLGVNQFSGGIPPAIFNLSSMQKFTLPFNQFHGKLPLDIGFTMPNLLSLNIGHNLFSGSLPNSISNASNLFEIDITQCNFDGKVSVDFGGFSGLELLILASNPLGEGTADDLSFLKSLSNSQSLRILDLSECRFGGFLPDSIGNLSTQLLGFRIGGNLLSGTIPSVIRNLANLTELQLQGNRISGSVPGVLGDLRMLRFLDLSENQLSGNIPSSLSQSTRLYSIHLENNKLSGKIPGSIGDLKYLQELDLSQNYLNGTIPERLMSLRSLTIGLNLSGNQLSGHLPSDMGGLINLGRFDVSHNMLSGEIPITIGTCLTLETLAMADNFLEGHLPPSFKSLRGLQVLDLSRNKLSGQIPDFLQEISLRHLNLSFNQFNGEVPAKGVFQKPSDFALSGNGNLCGGISDLKLPPCQESDLRKKRSSLSLKLMIPLLLGLLGLVLLMSILIVRRLRRRIPEPVHSSSPKMSLLSRVSYEELSKATDGFSSSNLIGRGAFGSVYRGILNPDETVFAVKVFHLHHKGALKSFKAECEALRNIRHRNLVKIYTSCSSIDFQGNEFKALVYEFMPNGSLESCLHPPPLIQEDEDKVDVSKRRLGLLERVNIAIDVASALDYLHNNGGKPIVHCDLKPANILLDENLTARVSDFGLARFIQELAVKSLLNQSTGMRGTVGYVAPEYGMGGKISTNGDIYSFGIILLEMLTGKRPTDSMFNDDLNLHNFAKAAIPGEVNEILDPTILPSGGQDQDQDEEEKAFLNNEIAGQSKTDQIRECMISLMRIGIACSVDSPRQRMDIGDVVKEVQLIRTILLAADVNCSSTSGSIRFEGSSSRSATSNWQNIAV